MHHIILDHQFITSPENISLLAGEYLENYFLHYKKSQIIKLNNNKMKIFSTSTENYKLKKLKKDNDSLSNKIKSEVISKIEKKKTELRKLQELYSHPKKLPEEIKITVAKKIEKTRADLKKLYSYPQDAINLKKIQKWGAIQVVKVFLGIPIVPGK